MRFCLFLCCALMVVSCKPEPIACADINNQDVNKIYIGTQGVDCGLVDFDIEVALTPAQQIQGLMNRETLSENAGMLFLFNDESERNFWMKNTLIALDIIFIKNNGVIHHIHENAKPLDLTRINSNGDVSAVLEINGGLSKTLNIKKGDTINHPFFNRLTAENSLHNKAP